MPMNKSISVVGEHSDVVVCRRERDCRRSLADDIIRQSNFQG